MEQLLQIHTTHGKIRIQSQPGEFYRKGSYGDAQPRLNMRTERGGGVKMEKTPSKLEINTDEVINSIRPNTSTIIAQMAEKGKQAAMAATAEFARMGNMYMDPNTNAILQDVSSMILEDGNKWFTLGWSPTVQIETTFTPEELSFSYQRDRIVSDFQRGTNEFDYRKGDTTTEVAQPGNVDIKYVGGFRRFPTGSGSRIDTRA